MTNIYNEIALEEICTNFLLEKDSLAAQSKDPTVIATATDASQVARSFALLDGLTILGCEATHHLHVIVEVTKRRLEEETLEIRSVFEGYNDPEIGAVGSIYEERVMTPSGKMVELFYARLLQLCYLQKVLSARIEAERIVNRKMRPQLNIS
jgi:hypothetical protein